METVYPAITDTAGNLTLIAAAGYETVGHFALPRPTGGMIFISRSASACRCC
jgi:hypothetical protein